MSTTAATTFTMDCSFCNKDKDQVKKLIAGPGVYICDECIGLCNTILDEEAKGSGDWVPAPSPDEAPIDHCVAILGAMASTVHSMEERLGDWARTLSKRGVALSTIASQVGITEADARDRFGL